MDPGEVLPGQEDFRELIRNGDVSDDALRFLEGKFLVPAGITPPHEDSLALLGSIPDCTDKDCLDIGCGTGSIGILLALRGAKSVIGLDWDPKAILTAEQNAKLHGVDDRYQSILSDVYDGLPSGSKFDVITANLPFVKVSPTETPLDFVDSSFVDTNFQSNKMFIKGLKDHLKPGGSVYFAQSNFGNYGDMIAMADACGFDWKLIGLRPFKEVNPDINFLAFKLTPRPDAP